MIAPEPRPGRPAPQPCGKPPLIRVQPKPRNERPRRHLYLYPLFALLPACADPETPLQTFQLNLHASTAEGEPLANVRLWGAGRALGVTDAQGMLVARLDAQPGRHLELTRTCPQGFDDDSEQRRLRMPQQPLREGLEVHVTCRSVHQSATLVIRVDGPVTAPLPITVEGEPVGQTEADGTGHVLLAVTPHSTVHVALDTSQQPDLRPQHPVHTFQVDDRDPLLLVDQHFTRHLARVPRPPPPVRPPPAPPPPLPPVRIH